MYKHITMIAFLLLTLSGTLDAQELKQVSFKTSWLDQFQFAGYYIAKEKGFYQDAGLHVDIQRFDINNDTNITEQVNSGKIDFSVGRETLILDKSKNKNIVLLYALFQASPLVLVSTKESNINSFTDFFGKTVMTSINDAQQVSIKAMLNANNVPLDDINFIAHTHNINDLINKKTDIMSAYVSKSPYELQAQGIEYNVFSPLEFDFDMYSDFLYTSEALIVKDIETVKAFREASLKGWEYAFNHIEESVNLILKKYNQQNLSKEALLFEAIELKKLAYLNTEKIGSIDEHKLKRIFDLYKVLGQVQASINFKQLIFDEKHYKAHFSQQETNYLNQKNKITLCVDPNWLPYDGLNNNGKHIGLNTEFFDIFSAQLPIPIEVIATSSWQQSVSYAKQRKCDLLSFASNTPERQKYLNFTEPYLSLPRVLVTSIKQPFISNFSLLKNKNIGIVKQYALKNEVQERYPDINIIDIENIKRGLEQVASGQLDGVIDGLDTVGYFLQKKFLGQLKVSGTFDKDKQLGLGVRNDEPLLLSVFNKLIKNLTPSEINRITDKSATITYVERFNYKILWWSLLLVLLIISAFSYKQYLLKNLNKALNEKVSEKTKALQILNENLEIKIKERTETIERSKELLQNVAYKDNLTGIFNRHYLFEKSVLFFDNATDYNEPLSMLLIDIDHFKEVNDVYGHIIGDNIIKYCVGSIQKNLRTDDLFARYGGEEFLVLLPKLRADESIKVAEKLRIYFERHHYHSDSLNQAIPITISIGISEFKVGDSLEKFIDRTDSALYKAKENGRNQVQIIEGTIDDRRLS